MNDFRTYVDKDYTPYLVHYGISKRNGAKIGSGRYPLGSGKQPFQSSPKVLKTQEKENKLAWKGRLSDKYTKDHTLPAGIKMYRVSADPNEKMAGQKYVSFLDVDRNHYRGGIIREHSSADKVYEYSMTSTEPIQVAGREAINDAVKQVLKGDPELIKKTVEKHVDVVLRSYFNTNGIDSSDMNKKGTEMYEYAKNLVNAQVDDFKNFTLDEAGFYACTTFGKNDTVRNKVADVLAKKGYNAMVDRAGAGGEHGYANNGGSPVIIFDTSVLQLDNVSEISKSEEAQANNKDWEFFRQLRKMHR